MDPHDRKLDRLVRASFVVSAVVFLGFLAAIGAKL